MAKLDQLVIELTAKIDGLQANLRTAQGNIKSFTKTAEKDIGGMETALIGARKAFVAFGGVWAAWRVGTSIIDAGISFQQLENRMKAATGSAEVAAVSMKFVREEAERLGLDFQATANGFAGFSASALRAGLTLQQTKEIFTGVSEAATSMQLSTDRVALVFKALEQIAGKGTVSMEELRGQLGDSLQGAFEIAAKAMGVTNQEFYKMVSNGEVLASEFLPKFGKAIREELGGSVEEASKGARASFNKLGNALYSLQTQFANAGFIDGVTDAVKRLTEALEDPATMQGLQDLASLLGLIAKAAGMAAEALLRLSSIPRMLVTGRVPGAPDPSLPISSLMKGDFDARADSSKSTAPGDVSSSYTLGKPATHMPSDKEIKAREKLERSLDELLYKLGGIGMDEISRDAYDKQGDAAQKLEDEQKLLQEALDQRLISEQEYRENMLKTELDYQEQLGKIRDDAAEKEEQRQQSLADIRTSMEGKALNSIHNLINTFAGKNKALAIAMLAFDKARAIAQAIMETHVAAAAALKYDPTGITSAYVTKLGYANVAAIAATGIAEAATLAKAGSGGGYSSSASGFQSTSDGGVGGPQQVAVTQSKNIYLNYSNEDFIWGPRQIRRFINDLQEQLGDGVTLKVAGI